MIIFSRSDIHIIQNYSKIMLCPLLRRCGYCSSQGYPDRVLGTAKLCDHQRWPLSRPLFPTHQYLIRAASIQVGFAINLDIADGREHQLTHESRAQRIALMVGWSYNDAGPEAVPGRRQLLNGDFAVRTHLPANCDGLMSFANDAALDFAAVKVAQAENGIEMIVAVHGREVWRKTDLPVAIIGCRVAVSTIVVECKLSGLGWDNHIMFFQVLGRYFAWG